MSSKETLLSPANGLKSIALLLDSAPRTWTSQEEIHFRLCRALKGLGIRPVLLYAAKLPAEIEQRLRESGAEIEIANYQDSHYQFQLELGRIIQRHSISIAHVCFFDYFSLVPWMARFHGVQCIIYEELNSGMLKATSWKKALIQLRTMLTSFPLLRVIAISEFVKEDLIKRGIAADRIVVKYLGVDEERFKPAPEVRQSWAAEYSLRPDELIMSTVTVLRPFKSPETLVEACGLLAQRGVQAKLFVAGDGVMMADLKELSKRVGAEDRINWLGYVKDPVRVLQASDVFLLASIGEAGGLALLEAMACGIPIVGSRSGCTIEYVNEGQTGLLATPKNAASFADAIERLSGDEKLRRMMMKNSRELALREFTVDIDVEKTLQLYESVWRESGRQ